MFLFYITISFGVGINIIIDSRNKVNKSVDPSLSGLWFKLRVMLTVFNNTL